MSCLPYTISSNLIDYLLQIISLFRTPMTDVPKGDWYCEPCQIINQNVDRLDYVKRKSTILDPPLYYE